MRMIMEHLEGGYSTAALARRYGVSRKTVHKWIKRHEQEPWEGLQERSRAPQHQAREFSEAMVRQILALKTRWSLWGAPKLHHKLRELVGEAHCPSESTVSNILKRHGLTQAPRRRRRAQGTGPLDHAHAPNQVWCADFKGWFLTGDGRRCQPLTITDASSRYLLRCVGLDQSTGWRVVRPLFEAAFREYGLPRAMRTDNGAPFGSTGLCGLTPLSVWWLKLGIEVERIMPGHPEQNGRHERMHRTLKQATANPPCRNLRAQQQAFEAFREQYNQERPHEALNFAVPAACYEVSARPYPERRLPPLEYPDEWQSRSVRQRGQIGWAGKNVPLTKALWGERVGLRPVGDGRWEVYFGKMLLGLFDERTLQVAPLKRKHHPPGAPEVEEPSVALRSTDGSSTSINPQP